VGDVGLFLHPHRSASLVHTLRPSDRRYGYVFLGARFYRHHCLSHHTEVIWDLEGDGAVRGAGKASMGVWSLASRLVEYTHSRGSVRRHFLHP
jgi:hypothetical protein